MQSLVSRAFVASASAAACALASLPAHAAGAGAFVDADIGTARNAIGSASFWNTDTSTWRVGAGYRWALTSSISLGLEAGYADLGAAYRLPVYFLAPDGSVALRHVRYAAAGPFVGFAARFDIAPSWFIGARAGAQRARYDVKPKPVHDLLEDKTGSYLGVSVGYDVGDAWSLGLGVDHSSIDFGSGRLHSNRLALQAEYRY
jgi:long-subunit fatty acid transport protein